MLASVQGNLASRWDDVRLFLALYRHRTLGAAGAEAALDASTLSRRLGALEDALATRLFDRTRDGLVPTAGAELLLPAAEEMAAAHARFVHDAAAFERLVEGSVRLAVPPGLAEAFVVPALARLQHKHPRLRLELDASTRFTDLTRNEADLALRTRRPQAGDLVSVKLGERRWWPVIAKRRAPKRAISAWTELPWIGWGEDMAEFGPARWLAKHVDAPAIVLRTSHVSAQAAALEAGLGAALLPPAFASRLAVVKVRHAAALAPSIDELPASETWLVGHRALRGVPRVAAVWAFLADEFSRFEPKA